MDQKFDLPQGMNMQEAMKMASSPAGQRLLKLLQQENGAELQQAMSSAAAGDYRNVKTALSQAMASPEVQALLRSLGGSHE